MKTFTTKVERFGGVGSVTYAAVPFDSEKAFNCKGRIKVKGTINGAKIRATIMCPDEEPHYLVLTRGVRVKANVNVGDTIQVIVEKDEDERPLAVPPDVEAMLKGNKKAAEYFYSLPKVLQRQFIMWVDEAKRQETRQKRIERVTQKLLNGEKLKEKRKAASRRNNDSPGKKLYSII